MGKFGTFFERFFSDFLAEGAGRMVFDQARLRVEKGFETSPTDIRVETNAFIAIDLKRYNPDAHRGLETQRTARRNWESSGGLYSPLDENRLEKILGDMWYNLRDKPGKRLEAFERLGLLGLNDPIEFNRAIEHLTHDPATQLAKWGISWAKKVARPVNYWGRWFVIIMLAVWPVTMVASALVLPGAKTELILLSFLLPVIFFLGLLVRYPLFVGILGAIPVTRTVLIGLGVIIGFELAMGAYLIWVPVHLAPKLFFLEMALVAIILLLGVKMVKESLGWISSIAVLAVIVITLMFFQKDVNGGGLKGRVDKGKTFVHEVRDAVAPGGLPGVAKGTWNFVFPTSDSTIWAEIGDPNKQFKELPPVDTVHIMIPPGQWWSIRYTRAEGVKSIRTIPNARLMIRAYYEDGSYDEFEEYPGFDPEARGKIVGFSFMNPYYPTPFEEKIVQQL